MKRKHKYWLFLASLVLILLIISSINHNFPIDLSDRDKRILVSDVDPQVIYRVDDHRYLTLENYISCIQAGEVYYHDSQKGIKTRISGDNWVGYKNIEVSLLSYKGIIINAADNGVIGFPYEETAFCNDKGCDAGVKISTDGGKTFNIKNRERYFHSSKKSKERKTVIANDVFYLNKSAADKTQIVSITNANDEIQEAKESPDHLTTPSGDTHYYCDNRIKPRSVKLIYPKTGKEYE